ncbi:MAG: hypothetical protein E7425_11355, partial [Ruminococcaceae bacterium]|nr:hypothetical protein [Oscillospiraceae bacterium]
MSEVARMVTCLSPSAASVMGSALTIINTASTLARSLRVILFIRCVSPSFFSVSNSIHFCYENVKDVLCFLCKIDKKRRGVSPRLQMPRRAIKMGRNNRRGRDAMSAVLSFAKKEPILIISALAALVSCFFVPPDAAYLGYIDFRTLALLYALMLMTAGLRKAGAFAHLAHMAVARTKGTRAMGVLLVALSFFSSMLITNDVALLTFVPIAVIALETASWRDDLVRVIVLQAIAANLGGMVTPVGNPQNLFIFTTYELSAGDFFLTLAPFGALSLILLVIACA